jgi:hypothetical protein
MCIIGPNRGLGYFVHVHNPKNSLMSGPFSLGESLALMVSVASEGRFADDLEPRDVLNSEIEKLVRRFCASGLDVLTN